MKRKFILLLLLLTSCGNNHNPNPDASELRAKLPQLQTPMEFNSDRMMKLKSIELPGNSLLRKLQEKNNFSLVGKVFDNGQNVTILGYIPDDIGTHVLVTYDNEGNKLSSHAIYETAMGDIGRYTTNIVKILPERSILFTDSTTTRKINEEGTDEIPGTDSVSVIHTQYKLTDARRIDEVH